MECNRKQYRDIFIRNVPSGEVRTTLYDFIMGKTLHLGGIQRLKILTGPDNEHLATTVAFLRMADPQKNEEANTILNYSSFTFRGQTRTLYTRLNDTNAYQDNNMNRDTMFISKDCASTQLTDKQGLVIANDQKLAEQKLALVKGELALAPHSPADVCATHRRHGERLEGGQTIWYVSVSAATFFAVGAQTATPRQTAEATNTVDAFIAVEQRRNGLKFLYKISLSLSVLLSVFFFNSSHS